MPIALAGCRADESAPTGQSRDDSTTTATATSSVSPNPEPITNDEVKVDPLQRIYRILFDKVQFGGIDALGESERVLF
ncbi:MAG: hypothetical protein ACKVT0_01860, partial [Planctomycetaceae bacterium]